MAGRKAGAGAIQCDSSRYAEFAKIWNASQETDEKLVIVKNGKKTEVGGRIVTILKALRTAKIADENTDASQVRAWQTSNSPSEAFEKAVAAGLFDTKEFKDEAERKAKLQSFRACVSQMQKQKIPLKAMGRKRASSIPNEVFIKIWNESNNIAEVKDKLVEAGVIKEDFKISSLKSKYKTLKDSGVELKKLKSGEGINDLMKLAALLAENPDAELPDEDEDEDDVDDDDDVDEDDVDEDDDDEDAEITDLDDILGD